MRKLTMFWRQSGDRFTAFLKVVDDKRYKYEESAGFRSFDSFDEATTWAYREASKLGFEKIEITSDTSS